LRIIFIDQEGQKEEKYVINPFSLIAKLTDVIKKGLSEKTSNPEGSDAICQYNFTHAIFLEFIDIAQIKSPHAKKLYNEAEV